LFVKNHYPLDVSWLLTDSQVAKQYFFKGPMVYADTFKYEIVPMEPADMHLEVKQNDEITFVLKQYYPIEINSISIEISSGSEIISSIKPVINQSDSEIITFKYTFKNRGLYDLHLKISNNYIATYTVNVNKHK
jgi:hypothetical protein